MDLSGSDIDVKLKEKKKRWVQRKTKKRVL
jgi:hypothetical protein